MATALLSTEFEFDELVTCGVCLCEFDTDVRKPKFLPCSHTICFPCLKEINRNYMVACPFCRNISTQIDVSNLPNNSYALQMLKLKDKKQEKVSPPDPKFNGPTWCFTCGTVTRNTCTTPDHSLVNLTVDTIKNMESFLSLKDELQTMKNEEANKLAMAILKRKEIKEHLDFLTKCLKSTMEEIDGLHDENNLLLTQLVSTLEGNGPKTHPTGDSKQDGIEDLFLSGLASLMNDSSSPAEDTADALKVKLNKSVEMFEEQFQEATAKATEYEFQKKTKIKIILLDEKDQPIPTFPLLENGFRLIGKKRNNHGSYRQDLNLLSYLVFSLLRKQKLKTKVEAIALSVPAVPVPSISQAPDPVLFPKSTTEDTKSDGAQLFATSGGVNSQVPDPVVSVRSATEDTKSEEPKSHFPTSLFCKSYLEAEDFLLLLDKPIAGPSVIPRPLSNKFILDQSIFIFRLFYAGALKGEIHIQPVNTFHPDFMNILGINCFKTQKHFSNSVEKAILGIFASFPMARPQFQPVLPDMVANFPRQLPDKEVACNFGEVGINTISTCEDAVTGWTFVFPLENYKDPKFARHLKTLPSARLFGRVLHLKMLDAISQLCCTSRTDRTGYSITLESR